MMDRWAVYRPETHEIELGQAPRPRNQVEGFIHHLCHGIIMRYPLHKIIMWSWLHRKGFQNTNVLNISITEHGELINSETMEVLDESIAKLISSEE